jgi:hypothetical protein
MYSNIDHDDALVIIRQALEDNVNMAYDIQRPPTDSLIELLSLVMKSNVFVWDPNHLNVLYRQVLGLAMGSSVSPSASDCAVYKIDKLMIAQGAANLLHFKRFRDDANFAWIGTRHELDLFIEYTNNIDKNLRYTFEISDTKIVFMDLEIYKGPRFKETGVLDLKLHFKPTNTFQYLSTDSCHPSHVFKGIVIGEISRARRNTSSEVEFIRIRDHMVQKFLARNYPEHKIWEWAYSIKFQDRNQALHKIKQSKAADTPPVMVTKFDPTLDYLNLALRKNWNLIENCPAVHILFPRKPIVAFRKSDSIANTLVRARLSKLF